MQADQIFLSERKAYIFPFILRTVFDPLEQRFSSWQAVESLGTPPTRDSDSASVGGPPMLSVINKFLIVKKYRLIPHPSFSLWGSPHFWMNLTVWTHGAYSTGMYSSFATPPWSYLDQRNTSSPSFPRARFCWPSQCTSVMLSSKSGPSVHMRNPQSNSGIISLQSPLLWL